MQKADYLTYQSSLTTENDFDSLISTMNSIHIININSDDFKLTTCSCTFWHKNFICKHIVDIGLRLNKVEIPNFVMDIPLSRKRKRGAHTKTKSALHRQNDNDQTRMPTIAETSDSENEPECLAVIKPAKKSRGRQRKN